MNNKILLYIRDWIITRHPSFWLSNYPVSRSWDKTLRKMMLSCDSEITESGMAVHFTSSEPNKGINVWVENYPYAYGRTYLSSCDKVLPTKITRLRLHRFIEAKRLDIF